MAAAPAAAAPIAVEFAIGLLGVAVFLVCLGLHGAWLHTFGHLFKWLAHKGLSLGRFGTVRPLRFLESVSNDVANWLLHRAEDGEALMGYMFHAAARTAEWMARETADLAAGTLHWATWLQRSHLPKWVKALIAAAVPVLALPIILRAIHDLRLPHVVRTTVIRTTRVVRHDVTRIVKATAGAVAIPAVFWHLFPRMRDLRRDVDSVRRRLRRLERSAGAVATVGLVAAALGRLGLNWIRCRRVSRVGKAVCGMDSQLLGALLADTTLILGTISIVELTKGTQRLMPAITDATGYLVREAPQAWNDAPRDVIAAALRELPDFPG